MCRNEAKKRRTKATTNVAKRADYLGNISLCCNSLWMVAKLITRIKQIHIKLQQLLRNAFVCNPSSVCPAKHLNMTVIGHEPNAINPLAHKIIHLPLLPMDMESKAAVNGRTFAHRGKVELEIPFQYYLLPWIVSFGFISRKSSWFDHILLGKKMWRKETSYFSQHSPRARHNSCGSWWNGSSFTAMNALSVSCVSLFGKFLNYVAGLSAQLVCWFRVCLSGHGCNFTINSANFCAK